MTGSSYYAQGSSDSLRGAGVVLALLGVMALGLMGFASGFAKADRATSPWRMAQATSSSLARAKVSAVVPGADNELLGVGPGAPTVQIAATPPTPRAVPVVTSISAPAPADIPAMESTATDHSDPTPEPALANPA